jgi:hypothetical protein
MMERELKEIPSFSFQNLWFYFLLKERLVERNDSTGLDDDMSETRFATSLQ